MRADRHVVHAHPDAWDRCPTCLGHGFVEQRLGEPERQCWTCNGVGEVPRDNARKNRRNR